MWVSNCCNGVMRVARRSVGRAKGHRIGRSPGSARHIAHIIHHPIVRGCCKGALLPIAVAAPFLVVSPFASIYRGVQRSNAPVQVVGGGAEISQYVGPVGGFALVPAGGVQGAYAVGGIRLTPADFVSPAAPAGLPVSVDFAPPAPNEVPEPDLFGEFLWAVLILVLLHVIFHKRKK